MYSNSSTASVESPIEAFDIRCPRIEMYVTEFMGDLRVETLIDWT
jgi:hypothetical protein